MFITSAEQWLLSSSLQFLVLYSVLFNSWCSCWYYILVKHDFAHEISHKFPFYSTYCSHFSIPNYTIGLYCMFAVRSSGSEVVDLSFNCVLVKYVMDNDVCVFVPHRCAATSSLSQQSDLNSSLTASISFPLSLLFSPLSALNRRANAFAKTFEGKLIIKSFPPSY